MCSKGNIKLDCCDLNVSITQNLRQIKLQKHEKYLTVGPKSYKFLSGLVLTLQFNPKQKTQLIGSLLGYTVYDPSNTGNFYAGLTIKAMQTSLRFSVLNAKTSKMTCCYTIE
jgi:hypothetical protein